MPWVAPACTLPAERQPLRVREFDDLFGSVHSIIRVTPTRLRLAFDGGDDLAATAHELAARESACCSFFSFEISRPDPATVVMLIDVPVVQVGVLASLADRAARAGAR